MSDLTLPSPKPADNGTILRRTLLVAIAAIVIAIVPFLLGLVGSLILYVLTRSTHARLSRVLPPRASAMVTSLGVITLLLLPGAWLASTIVTEMADAMRRWNPDALIAWIGQTPFGRLDVSQDIASGGATVVGWLSGRAVAVADSVTLVMLNVLMAMFGLYYLLLGGGSLWSRIKRLLPVSDRIADLLATRFVEVTDALMVGTALVAAMQGTIVGIAFAIVGLQPAVLWGFVTACVSILPLFGSALVWLPGAAVLLANHRSGAAVLLVGLGLVASNLDNLVRPFLFRRISGIHPMLALVGAFAGGRLFGLIGAFIGPLVLSYFVELVAVYEAHLVEDATSGVTRSLSPIVEGGESRRAGRLA